MHKITAYVTAKTLRHDQVFSSVKLVTQQQEKRSNWNHVIERDGPLMERPDPFLIAGKILVGSV